MRIVIQRVCEGKVKVEDKISGRIGRGVAVFVGFEPSDNGEDFTYIAEKIANLRIFEDSEGKMNLSVKDIKGGILVIPNFTLYGDARKGRRPSFSNSSDPQTARDQFGAFCEVLKKENPEIQTGVFREYMEVSLVNDGPVTILLDSKRTF